MRADAIRQHLHDELVAALGDRWCECGDGPFTSATWDEHRMAMLGSLPVTREGDDLLDELDRYWTTPSRRDQIEAALLVRASGGTE